MAPCAMKSLYNIGMDPNRTQWNEQIKTLRALLNQAEHHAQAVDLFMVLHAAVYSARLEPTCPWSAEDETWRGLSDAAARRRPPGGEHSIAWMAWHTARCEDITMNLLVAARPQVLLDEGWLERLGVPDRDTGNAMTPEEVDRFSTTIDLDALREYRLAVARRTRAIVRSLPPGSFKQKMDPARVAEIYAQGAVVPAASYLTDYWGAQTAAGLLLMPCTRHHLVHWNEAARMKSKLKHI